MRVSDMIAEVILSMMGEEGFAEIQRNELAGQLNCVPSQINYVLSTRFSPEQGYLIESRRGGGGYIRIQRILLNEPSLLMHTVSCIGNQIDAQTANAILRNLCAVGELTRREARMIATMLTDVALAAAPDRAELRARLLKGALMSAANDA